MSAGKAQFAFAVRAFASAEQDSACARMSGDDSDSDLDDCGLLSHGLP